MSNKQSIFFFWVLVILVLLAIGGLAWVNYRYSLENPGGNDFLPRWVGTRYFLLNGWSPYSDQTSEVIQNIAYGEIADEGQDKMLFVYPFYSILLFSPYSLISNYALARGLWMTTLQLVLFLITVFSISLAKWKPSSWMLAIIILFSVVWYHGLRPTINGNASIFVALFIVLALVSIQRDKDFTAGLWLAASTIKPQMVVLALIYTILWTAVKRRWNLLLGTFVGLGILFSFTSLLIPDWLLQNIRQVISYPSYTLPGTPSEIFAAWLPGVGKQTGWFLSIALAIILLFEWRAALNQDFSGFYWTFCLTLVITNLIGIKTATENYVLMFPALILIYSALVARWGKFGRTLVLVIVVGLFAGLWYLFMITLRFQDQPIQHSIMFFPLPVILFIGLYWMRWWVLKSPRLFADRQALSE